MKSRRAVVSVGLSSALLLGLGSCSAPRAEKPTLDSLTSAQIDHVYAAEADSAWQVVSTQYSTAVRPEVTQIRTVSNHDWAETMAGCLQDSGFNAKPIAGGGIASGDVPAAQMEAYAVKQFECSVQYPFEFQHYVPLNNSQLKFLYSYYVDVLTPCLREQGLEIGDGPSWVKFEEGFGTESAWAPYGETNVFGAQLTKVQELCPGEPEGLFGP